MKEYSDETLKKNYDHISTQYEEQFVSAGFPPKICAGLVGNLCSES